MLTSSGCANLDKRLVDAAVTQAVAEADVNLPQRPVECVNRAKEEHSDLKNGAEIRVLLRNERKALERQQARQDRCESFYDDVWVSYN